MLALSDQVPTWYAPTCIRPPSPIRLGAAGIGGASWHGTRARLLVSIAMATPWLAIGGGLGLGEFSAARAENVWRVCAWVPP